MSPAQAQWDNQVLVENRNYGRPARAAGAGAISIISAPALADEFALAREVPLSFIEWIYDLYGADENPLTNDLDRLRSLSRQTGVTIRSVCADYFMDLPFLRCSPAECTARQQRLNLLLGQAAQVGVSRVVLPLLTRRASKRRRMKTGSSKSSKGRSRKRKRTESNCTSKRISARAPLPRFSVVSRKNDSGQLRFGQQFLAGFAPAEEFEAYGERIGSIHIKDRVRGVGPCRSVPVTPISAPSSMAWRESTTPAILRCRWRAQTRAGSGMARKNRAFIERFWAVE